MIICNGDSFTQGWALNDPMLAWPMQLGSILNQPVVSSAMGGASNERILRTLREDLVNYPEHQTVIVGWTVNDRNEIHHYTGDYIRALAGGSAGEKTDNSSNTKDLEIIGKHWVTHQLNEYLNFRDLIYNILILQDYFDNKKINYKFFLAWGTNWINEFLNQSDASLSFADQAWSPRDKKLYEPLKDNHIDWNEMCNLVKKIDLDRWVLKNQYTMQGYLDKNNFDLTTDYGHPLADGHRAWAEVIAKDLK